MTPLSGDEYAVPGRHPLVPRELVRLALDNDELVPWFQPVVSARTGKLTGCEILMRQRVTRIAVSLPEAFIMQVEISGLIVPKYLKHIWQRVGSGEYRLLPPQLIRTGKQDDIVLWSAADAMVMKWGDLEIKNLLPMQSQCVHTAGHRGVRDSLAEIEITQTLKQGARFVWRTDIRGYYRHIRKEQLWHHLCRFVRSPVLLNIIKQYIWYAVEHGGEFFTPQGGICRGSALSPLLGASFLWYVDSAFSRQVDKTGCVHIGMTGIV
ncbi:TPA: EAL domain-containing protein, partial [Escherichia coli]|nr:EAL domain-containing protein [Escherichia coli]